MKRPNRLEYRPDKHAGLENYPGEPEFPESTDTRVWRFRPGMRPRLVADWNDEFREDTRPHAH